MTTPLSQNSFPNVLHVCSESRPSLAFVAMPIADQWLCWSAQELVNLIVAVVAINGWNRLAISIRWLGGAINRSDRA